MAECEDLLPVFVEKVEELELVGGRGGTCREIDDESSEGWPCGNIKGGNPCCCCLLLPVYGGGRLLLWL